LLDALRASSHSPTGKACGTLPFGFNRRPVEVIEDDLNRIVRLEVKGSLARLSFHPNQRRVIPIQRKSTDTN